MIFEVVTDGHIISCPRCRRGTLYQRQVENMARDEIRKVRCGQCGQRLAVIGVPMIVPCFWSELQNDELPYNFEK